LADNPNFEFPIPNSRFLPQNAIFATTYHSLIPVTSIQKFIAGLLLVVFAFGISPKRSWHNLVANHKDGKPAASAHDHRAADISRAAFNCQCDNLISESPFVAEATTTEAVPVIYHTANFIAIPAAPYSSDRFSFCLRGPPAC
jgi:hypothetical protein